jgi:hypothetical protein
MQSRADFGKKKEEEDAIVMKRDSRLKQIYKTIIKKNIDRLNASLLTEEEKYCIKFINFNPHMMIVLDDCAAYVSKWGKNETINRLFFESRHIYVTSFYTMQDDKKLETGIRKNTYLNVFTDANCAISFFINVANSFSKDEKKTANLIANSIFQPNEYGIPNYKKMIYCRKDTTNKFRYILVDKQYVMGTFRMGSQYLWDLCERIPEDDHKTTLSKDNQFYAAFKI